MELDTVVKDGQLDFATPLPFPDGAVVHVVIELKHPNAQSDVGPDPQRASRILAEIAAIPSTNSQLLHEEDIDSVLYGQDHL